MSFADLAALHIHKLPHRKKLLDAIHQLNGQQPRTPQDRFACDVLFDASPEHTPMTGLTPQNAYLPITPAYGIHMLSHLAHHSRPPFACSANIVNDMFTPSVTRRSMHMRSVRSRHILGGLDD